MYSALAFRLSYSLIWFFSSSSASSWPLSSLFSMSSSLDHSSPDGSCRVSRVSCRFTSNELELIVICIVTSLCRS